MSACDIGLYDVEVGLKIEDFKVKSLTNPGQSYLVKEFYLPMRW